MNGTEASGRTQNGTNCPGFGSPVMIEVSLSELASKNCVPCKGTTPLSPQEASSRLASLPNWRLADSRIEREFRFKSYLPGLDFAYAVGKLAGEQDHHPEITIGWRRVKLVFTTHVIKGLSMNDFIMAAKSEVVFERHVSPAKGLPT